MRISDVKINGITNPVGFHTEDILCSWKVTETESRKQTNAVIEVSRDPEFQEICYRKEGNLKQQGEKLEFAPQSRTTYYYQVSVTGDEGDLGTSETQIFETGKMNEAWEADWIAAQPEDTFHPILRKVFSVEKGISRARFYGTGVGMFELYVNGAKVGEEYLAPYVNNYETNIQVLTYALDTLAQGENTVEILLGKGWYMGLFGLELQKNNFGSRMAAIAEIHLEYEDGTSEVISTDGTWEYQGSVIEDSGIYDGEIVNELLYDGKENPWKPVAVLKKPEEEEPTRNLAKSHLMDRLSLPVLAKETLEVQEIITTPAGETVLDFGQNFAGFVQFTADFEKGTKIVLECAEILQQGNFYHGNYRDAESKFTFISNGTKETMRPHFTFFGFRYIRVTGWPGTPAKEDFAGKVLYSDIEQIGFIHTSDPKINRLFENTVWGLKGNFIDMPTDCPQRSERLGWTGDAQVFSPTACYHMDTRAFFHKFIKDLRDEQKFLDGGVANYVPNIGHLDDYGSVWGDVATFLPFALYNAYGSVEELAYAYPLMHDWVDCIDRQDAARGRQYLYTFGFHFGDWLALDGPTPTSFKGSTNDDYIASMYYYRSVQIVREAAELLGKKDDVERFKDLEGHIYKAILDEFYSPTGRLCIDTQAAYVIALKFKVYVDRQKIIDAFKLRLKRDCNQIKCGFVGAPLLCTVMGEAGMFETAYDFLLKEDFPSWLYSVNLGATTIWERWNSVGPDGTISDTGMNSLNHYSYGSVMEFVYAYAAGIRALEPGYKKAIIAPHPDVRLREMECIYDSVSGKYYVSTKIGEDGTMTVKVEVPFNCEARVELPGYPEGALTLSAGSYEYSYVPETDYRKPYSKDTTLSRISKDPKAMGTLAKYAPAIAGIAGSGNPEMGANTLEDISHMGYLPFEPDKLAQAIEELTDLVV